MKLLGLLRNALCWLRWAAMLPAVAELDIIAVAAMM